MKREDLVNVLEASASKWGEKKSADISCIIETNWNKQYLQKWMKAHPNQSAQSYVQCVECHYDNWYETVSSLTMQENDDIVAYWHSRIKVSLWRLLYRNQYKGGETAQLATDYATDALIDLFVGRAYYPYHVPFLGWILRVAHNHCNKGARNSIRKWRNIVPLEFLESDPSRFGHFVSAEDHLHHYWLCQKLSLALKKLCVEDQYLIEMRYYRAKPLKQIAEETGKTYHAVYSRHSNAKQRLGLILTEMNVHR